VIPQWLWLVVLAILILLLVFGYTVGSRVTGFGPHVVKKTENYEYRHGEDRAPIKTSETRESQTGRTFWDWMTILTISAVIGVVGLIFTLTQAQKQQAIQDQQAMDTVLQEYLDQMTQMVLDKNILIRSDPDSPAGVAARVRTLTAMKRLDGAHNKIIMTFLKESRLINFSVPGDQKEGVLRLDQSDLNSVKLARNSLSGVNLRFAQLQHADLHDANLSVTNLTFADLEGANLIGADLRDADLRFANLEGAKLEGANFRGARLLGVDLSGANLENAKNLTQYHINQAGAGDAATKLPEVDDQQLRWSNPRLRKYQKISQAGPRVLYKLLHKPKWWSKQDAHVRKQVKIPMLQDSRLEASLVALDSLNKDMRKEIGIPKDAGDSEDWSNNGALVYDVQPGGPAYDARLSAGDIIVLVDRNGVQGLQDLKNTLDHKQGQKVRFTTWRHYFQQNLQKDSQQYSQQGWHRGALDGRLGE
jgi:Pentapeptide repeats (8 copies)/PDZ domain